MKFYALVLWRTRGVVASQLKLHLPRRRRRAHLRARRGELLRFERTLLAIWAAIERAVATGDFRPNRTPAVRLVRPPALCPSSAARPRRSPPRPPPRPVGHAAGRRAAGRRAAGRRAAGRRVPVVELPVVEHD
jgi:RecB family exonuclease